MKVKMEMKQKNIAQIFHDIIKYKNRKFSFKTNLPEIHQNWDLLTTPKVIIEKSRGGRFLLKRN